MAAGRAIGSPWAVGTVLDRLAGGWSFAREIDNGVRVAGLARCTPAPDRALIYREDGRMALPGGGALDAFADYRFVGTPAGLDMLFPGEPPALFQSFRLVNGPDGLTAASDHACPPDAYRSRLTFLRDGRWSLIHTVSGPRKDYRSVTLYTRAPDGVLR